MNSNHSHTLRNISIAVILLLAWAGLHYLFLYLKWDRQFMKLDVAFMILPPICAFFLNWRWLFHEHPNVMQRWMVLWPLIYLALFIPTILFASTPLNTLLNMIRNGG